MNTAIFPVDPQRHTLRLESALLWSPSRASVTVLTCRGDGGGFRLGPLRHQLPGDAAQDIELPVSRARAKRFDEIALPDGHARVGRVPPTHREGVTPVSGPVGQDIGIASGFAGRWWWRRRRRWRDRLRGEKVIPCQLAVADELRGFSTCGCNLTVEVAAQKAQQLDQSFAISGGGVELVEDRVILGNPLWAPRLRLRGDRSGVAFGRRNAYSGGGETGVCFLLRSGDGRQLILMFRAGCLS